MRNLIKNFKGQALIELLIAIAFFAIFGLGIAILVLNGLSSTESGAEESYASFLAQEGLNAARSIRDQHWMDLDNGDHGLQNSGGFWEFLGASNTLGKYTRTVNVDGVNRDSGGNIVLSGGFLDPRTKLITATVTWNPVWGVVRSISAFAYFVDWNVFDWFETNETDFGDGTHSYTVVEGTGDNASVYMESSEGEPQLGDLIWQAGGGQIFHDTTDEDFGAGTLNDVVIEEIGIPARVALAQNVQWDIYEFPFGKLELYGVHKNWVVGKLGKTYNWTEGFWLEVDSPVTDTLNDIFEYSSNQVYAVGDNGTTIRYNGYYWEEVPTQTSKNLLAVYMLSSSDGFSIGRKGTIQRWNGSAWELISSPTNKDLHSLYCLDDDLCFAVGQNGTILQWDGDNWTDLSSPTNQTLESVWMVSSTDGWAVGHNGTIVQYNGSNWSTVSSPVNDQLNGVSMISGNDGWIVGNTGTFLQWDGSSWTSFYSPTSKHLEDIYMISGTNGWVVGADGEVYRWSGSNWFAYTQQQNEKFNDIHILSSTFGVSVGEAGIVEHWDGYAWSEIENVTNTRLNGVYMLSETDGFIVGDGGEIFEWDGNNWSGISSPVSSDLNSVSLVSSLQGYAVGNGGEIIAWNGSIWSSIISPTGSNLYDVSMISSGDGFAVGAGGVILRWNGMIWSSVSSPTGLDLYSVDMFSSSFGIAVGANGVVLQWDGVSWTSVSSPTGNNLNAVSVFSEEVATAVGTSGTMINIDEGSWVVVDSPTTRDLKGVDYLTEAQAWAVGDNGIVSRYAYYSVTNGTFESRIFDSGNTGTSWDLLYWGQYNYSVTDLTIATRTGDTAVPDGTWSAWSAELTDNEQSFVTSPDAQYFQYRATFSTSNIIVTPRLLDMTIIINDPMAIDDYNGISLVSDTDGWGVGNNGRIIHLGDTHWSVVSSPVSTNLFAVDALSTNDVWAVGVGGTFIHWDGASWTQHSTAITDTLYGVVMIANDDAWAVGAGGVIYHWDGVDWNIHSSPTTENLRAVSFISATDGWAVGDNGTAIYWNGSAWSLSTTGLTEDLYGVNMLTTDNVWAVGSSGKNMWWNGSVWTDFEDRGSEIIHDVFLFDEDTAYGVADGGLILMWDGVAWLIDVSPVDVDLHAVELTAEDNGWALGVDGTILHLTHKGSGAIGEICPEVEAQFVDDTQAEFDAGSYSDTEFDAGNEWVELNAAGLSNGSGTFTSDIKDSTDAAASWDNLAWLPQAPYGKELPDSAQSESGYNEGNADMTNNVLLMHLNESSGGISDSSGQSNNGIPSGGPSYGQTGKLNTALGFDAVDDVVTVSDAAGLDLTDAVTVEGWFNVTDVAVSAGGSAGLITDTPVDSYEFETDQSTIQKIINLSGDVYLVAFEGPDGDGWLKTVEMDSAGSITASVIDSYEFDSGDGHELDLIHIGGNVYAVVFRDRGNDGWIATVEVAANGQITNNRIDDFEFDSSRAYDFDITHVSGDIYAIVYQGSNQYDGFVITVEIDSSGNITNSVIDSYEFDTADASWPDIINISGNVFAITYQGPGDDGFIKTVTIDAAGNITNSTIDTLEFDTTAGYEPYLIPINGNIYAVAYRGSGDAGYIKTVEIAINGQITNTVIDTLQFSAGYGGQPNLVNITSDYYLVAYRGADDDGFAATVEISSAGVIVDSVIDVIEFDSSNGNWPVANVLASNMVAIVYTGADDDGYLTTLEISAGTPGGPLKGGVVKADAYALEMDTTTAYATINSQTINASINSGWNHIAMTYDRTLGSNQQKLYVNGSNVANGTLTSIINTNANDVIIGENIEAIIDEVAIYSEALDATVILDHYKRGVLSLNFQVRSCDDENCDTETFVGSDGTGGDYFNEFDNTALTPPSFDLSGIVGDNQYFQYQAVLATDDAAYSPQIKTVTIDYTTVQECDPGGGGGVGDGSCLAGTGVYYSNVVNSDYTTTAWETLYWDEYLPTGTDITIAVRSGNTAVPDGSWASFTSEFTDPLGNFLGLTGQYAQYRATLTTNNPSISPCITPELQDVTITYK